MHWVQIDENPYRWMLVPYSTQHPDKITDWWHQEGCKIDTDAKECTCTTNQRAH